MKLWADEAAAPLSMKKLAGCIAAKMEIGSPAVTQNL